jgi:hypothetical protein
MPVFALFIFLLLILLLLLLLLYLLLFLLLFLCLLFFILKFIDSLKPVRVVHFDRRFGSDLDFGFVKSKADGSREGRLFVALLFHLYFFHEFSHLLFGEFLFVLNVSHAQGGVHSFVVFFDGFSLFGSETFRVVLFISLQVPISFPPLSAFVEDTDGEAVTKIHFSVLVRHFADVFPVEEGPATTVTASDGDPDFSVLLLLELGNGH